jgi:hypothetical protein
VKDARLTAAECAVTDKRKGIVTSLLVKGLLFKFKKRLGYLTALPHYEKKMQHYVPLRSDNLAQP